MFICFKGQNKPAEPLKLNIPKDYTNYLQFVFNWIQQMPTCSWYLLSKWTEIEYKIFKFHISITFSFSLNFINCSYPLDKKDISFAPSREKLGNRNQSNNIASRVLALHLAMGIWPLGPHTVSWAWPGSDLRAQIQE